MSLFLDRPSPLSTPVVTRQPFFTCLEPLTWNNSLKRMTSHSFTWPSAMHQQPLKIFVSWTKKSWDSAFSLLQVYSDDWKLVGAYGMVIPILDSVLASFCPFFSINCQKLWSGFFIQNFRSLNIPISLQALANHNVHVWDTKMYTLSW